jgi:hypothetical protein
MVGNLHTIYFNKNVKIFFCFKAIFQVINFGCSYLKIEKNANSAFCLSLSYMAALPGDQLLVKKASGPFAGAYKPGLDESPELNPTIANFYQSQIGILRCFVELGRIDIITEVSILSTYLCLPHEGHLESVFHVFAYL